MENYLISFPNESIVVWVEKAIWIFGFDIAQYTERNQDYFPWKSEISVETNKKAAIHTSAKLIEIKINFLQPKHSPHGAVRQIESNETPHTPWGLRHL